MEDYIDELEERYADGDAEAARELYERYRDGDGVEQNDELAQEWLRRLKELRGETADFQDEPVGQEADYSSRQTNDAPANRAWKTEEELRGLPYQQQKLAQTKGNPFAISMFARQYLHSENPDEQRYGCRQLERANQIAQERLRQYGSVLRDMMVANYLCLGHYYEEQVGDPESAFAYYVDAHELDPAQVENLVRCYMNGIGCERDESAAWSLLEKAAINGGVKEQYAIGALLQENGQSIRAAEWYLSVLSREDIQENPAYAAACRCRLSTLRAPGPDGVIPDRAEAINMLEQLAKKGNATAALLRIQLAETPQEALKYAQIGERGTPEEDARACSQQAEVVAAKLRAAQEAAEARAWQERKEAEAAAKAAKAGKKEKSHKRRKRFFRVAVLLLIVGAVAFVLSPTGQHWLHRISAMKDAETQFSNGDYLGVLKTLEIYDSEDEPKSLLALREKAGTKYAQELLAQIPIDPSNSLETQFESMQKLKEGMTLLPDQEALNVHMDKLIRQYVSSVESNPIKTVEDLTAAQQQYDLVRQLCSQLPETDARKQTWSDWNDWFFARAEALTPYDRNDPTSLGAALDELEKLCTDAPEIAPLQDRRTAMRDQLAALVLERTALSEESIVDSAAYQQAAALLDEAQRHLPANNAALAERKGQLQAAYTAWCIPQLNAMRENQQYEAAAALLKEAEDQLQGNTSGLRETKEALAGDYVAWCTEQVQSLKAEHKYADAFALIEPARNLFGDNTSIISLYEFCAPDRLLDMHVIQSQYISEPNSDIIDSFGDLHNSSEILLFSGNATYASFGIFNLDKSYQYFSATIGVCDSGGRGRYGVKFTILDEKGNILYSSPSRLSLTTKPYTIEVPVGNIESLKIIVDGSDAGFGATVAEVFVENAYLFK